MDWIRLIGILSLFFPDLAIVNFSTSFCAKPRKKSSSSMYPEGFQTFSISGDQLLFRVEMNEVGGLVCRIRSVMLWFWFDPFYYRLDLIWVSGRFFLWRYLGPEGLALTYILTLSYMRGLGHVV